MSKEIGEADTRERSAPPLQETAKIGARSGERAAARAFARRYPLDQTLHLPTPNEATIPTSV